MHHTARTQQLSKQDALLVAMPKFETRAFKRGIRTSHTVIVYVALINESIMCTCIQYRSVFLRNIHCGSIPFSETTRQARRRIGATARRIEWKIKARTFESRCGLGIASRGSLCKRSVTRLKVNTPTAAVLVLS